MSPASRRGPIARSRAQRRSLAQLDHRPWPLPRGGWLVGQSWEDLLFAHWPGDTASLAPLVPPALTLDTFDGQPWIGLVPFRMRSVRFARLPPAPAISSFAELNLRTYVRHADRPGVLFITLEVANRVALELGRRMYGLPYRAAGVSLRTEGESVDFRSERAAPGEKPTSFLARYGPSGVAPHARAGTLEHWLTERYCFYTTVGGVLRRTEVHHPPWALNAARADIRRNSVGRGFGLDLIGEPLLHFSRAQDVVAWPPVPV